MAINGDELLHAFTRGKFVLGLFVAALLVLQGMNCAMEDCLLLDDELNHARDDWSVALPAFFRMRKPATDCLAQVVAHSQPFGVAASMCPIYTLMERYILFVGWAVSYSL